MELDELKQRLAYDPQTGIVRLRKSNRQLMPDAYGMISIYVHAEVKNYKFKLDKLSYELGYERRVPSTHKVLHKNLDEADNRLVNLTTVHRATYRKITEAARNLNGALRIVPHPEDQFSYFVEHYQNCTLKRQLIQDVTLAKKQVLKLQLKFAKFLNRYCVFD